MQRTASKTQSPVFKSTISVGLRVGNLLNPSGKEKGAPGEGADHIRAQLLLPVHACDCVHARVCVCVPACVRARSHRAAGVLGPRASSRPGAGRASSAGQTRVVRKRMQRRPFVCLCGSAPPRAPFSAPLGTGT